MSILRRGIEGLIFGQRQNVDERPAFRIRSKNYLVADEYPTWNISNEAYNSKIASEMRGSRGIDYFIGLCGGGTQVLYQLSLLTEQNSLKKVYIVDKLPGQLKNLEELVALFNDSKSNKDYTKRVWRDHDHNPKVPCGRPAFWDLQISTNILRPAPRYPVDLNLIQSDITTFLSQQKSPGKYFVYLSNALFTQGYIEARSANDLLLQIVNDNIFLDGTKIFSSGTWRPDGQFLIKSGKRFLLKEYGSQESSRKLALRRWLKENGMEAN